MCCCSHRKSSVNENSALNNLPTGENQGHFNSLVGVLSVGAVLQVRGSETMTVPRVISRADRQEKR